MSYIRWCFYVVSDGKSFILGEIQVNLYFILFYFCPVTEVLWEGEESEMKKPDSGTMQKADNTMKKAESNTVADNVKRLELSLRLLFALRYHCLAILFYSKKFNMPTDHVKS